MRFYQTVINLQTLNIRVVLNIIEYKQSIEVENKIKLTFLIQDNTTLYKVVKVPCKILIYLYRFTRQGVPKTGDLEDDLETFNRHFEKNEISLN